MKKIRSALLSYVVLLTLMSLDVVFVGNSFVHHRSPVVGLMGLIVIAAVLAVHPTTPCR